MANDFLGQFEKHTGKMDSSIIVRLDRESLFVNRNDQMEPPSLGPAALVKKPTTHTRKRH